MSAVAAAHDGVWKRSLDLARARNSASALFLVLCATELSLHESSADAGDDADEGDCDDDGSAQIPSQAAI